MQLSRQSAFPTLPLVFLNIFPTLGVWIIGLEEWLGIYMMSLSTGRRKHTSWNLVRFPGISAFAASSYQHRQVVPPFLTRTPTAQSSGVFPPGLGDTPLVSASLLTNRALATTHVPVLDAMVLTSPATVVVDHPLPRAIVPPSSHMFPTSIRRDMLADYLLHYDEQESTILLNGFINRFSLHCDGLHHFRTSGNHRSALQAQSLVDDKLLKEISIGRIAGPFTKPPFTDFHSSPLGLIPKHDQGKFRLIHDLSFPRGDSINFHTSKQFTSVQYETLDHVVDLVQDCGQDCFIAKADIKDAFRRGSSLTFVGSEY